MIHSDENTLVEKKKKKTLEKEKKIFIYNENAHFSTFYFHFVIYTKIKILIRQK